MVIELSPKCNLGIEAYPYVLLTIPSYGDCRLGNSSLWHLNWQSGYYLESFLKNVQRGGEELGKRNIDEIWCAVPEIWRVRQK